MGVLGDKEQLSPKTTQHLDSDHLGEHCFPDLRNFLKFILVSPSLGHSEDRVLNPHSYLEMVYVASGLGRAGLAHDRHLCLLPVQKQVRGKSLCETKHRRTAGEGRLGPQAPDL